ncbi:signal transduction histidine kinase [Nocardioides albus]|uniref:Signal transduction histidine kinase n=1 Tax=Nocardioides albus TaxID=1841 RepID=A0A7W5A655_9ACTN|nr:signal transduction histidine kinase [Nocardioides albus]
MAVVFLAVVFLAVVFLAVVFLAVVFLAVVFLAVVFFAGVVFSAAASEASTGVTAAAFFAGAFLAGAFLAVVFFAAVDFAVVDFLAGLFLAGLFLAALVVAAVFFADAFLAAVFFAGAGSFTGVGVLAELAACFGAVSTGSTALAGALRPGLGSLTFGTEGTFTLPETTSATSLPAVPVTVPTTFPACLLASATRFLTTRSTIGHTHTFDTYRQHVNTHCSPELS